MQFPGTFEARVTTTANLYGGVTLDHPVDGLHCSCLGRNNCSWTYSATRGGLTTESSFAAHLSVQLLWVLLTHTCTCVILHPIVWPCMARGSLVPRHPHGLREANRAPAGSTTRLRTSPYLAQNYYLSPIFSCPLASAAFRGWEPVRGGGRAPAALPAEHLAYTGARFNFRGRKNSSILKVRGIRNGE